MSRLRNTQEDFWAKTKVVGDCLEWQGSLNHNGYGQFSWKGNRNARVHRISYALTHNNGEIMLSNLLVCHTCDNRKCVKPDHLYLGTALSNSQDRVSRGRQTFPKGIVNGMSKLTEDEVKEIRLCYSTQVITYKELANRYSVSEFAVKNVVRRRTWKHVK